MTFFLGCPVFTVSVRCCVQEPFSVVKVCGGFSPSVVPALRDDVGKHKLTHQSGQIWQISFATFFFCGGSSMVKTCTIGKPIKCTFQNLVKRLSILQTFHFSQFFLWMMLHVLIRQVVGTNIQKTSSIQIISVKVLTLVLSSVLFIPGKMGTIYHTIIALNSLLCLNACL